MMEWTLAGLFVVSTGLLITSIVRSSHAAKVVHEQADQIHISTMKEINSLQDSIRNIELDIEVVMKEAGIQLSSERKLFMREVLDLNSRNYSVQSIAEMKQVTESEVEQVLASFKKHENERSKVANAN